MAALAVVWLVLSPSLSSQQQQQHGGAPPATTADGRKPLLTVPLRIGGRDVPLLLYQGDDVARVVADYIRREPGLTEADTDSVMGFVRPAVVCLRFFGFRCLRLLRGRTVGVEGKTAEASTRLHSCVCSLPRIFWKRARG